GRTPWFRWVAAGRRRRRRLQRPRPPTARWTRRGCDGSWFLPPKQRRRSAVERVLAGSAGSARTTMAAMKCDSRQLDALATGLRRLAPVGDAAMQAFFRLMQPRSFDASAFLLEGGQRARSCFYVV